MPLDLNENQIEWQITEATKGSERKIQIHGYRKSRARINRELSPSMLDASREIDRAYEDRSRGMGYAILGSKSVNLLSSGGGQDIREELIDAMRERINKLVRWEKACTPYLRDTVYALNQHQFTARTYADHTSKTTLEVMLWYKEGLRVYAKMQGWA